MADELKPVIPIHTERIKVEYEEKISGGMTRSDSGAENCDYKEPEFGTIKQEVFCDRYEDKCPPSELCDQCLKTGSSQYQELVEHGVFSWTKSVCDNIKNEAGINELDNSAADEVGSNDINTECNQYGESISKTAAQIDSENKLYIHDDCGVLHYKKKKNIRHKRKKQYKCDVCGLSFNQNGGLKAHQLIHSGDKPFKCEICGISFARNDDLKKHKRIHTGEKPYECDICQISFTESSGLKSHRRIHTGEKPYKCDICCKFFTHSCSLNVHKRLHTGEKPYKCDICGLCFTQNQQLKEHKYTHTSVKFNWDLLHVRPL